MRLSNKQEKAIDIAIQIMETACNNGNQDCEIEFAIDQLIKLKYSSIEYKRKQKLKKSRCIAVFIYKILLVLRTLDINSVFFFYKAYLRNIY